MGLTYELPLEHWTDETVDKLRTYLERLAAAGEGQVALRAQRADEHVAARQALDDFAPALQKRWIVSAAIDAVMAENDINLFEVVGTANNDYTVCAITMEGRTI